MVSNPRAIKARMLSEASEGECDRDKGKGGGREVQTVRPELESGCLRGGPIGSSGGERAYR